MNTHKRLVLTCIFMLSVLLFPKRTVAQADITVGIKGGMTSSDVTGINFSDKRTGFAIGGFATFDFPVFVSFQAEVFYVSKGYKIQFDQFVDLNGNVLIGNLDADFALSYLEIPLLLNFPLPILEEISPKLFFGPSVAFLLSDKVTFKNTSPQDQATFAPEGSLFENLDLGLVFGINISRPIAGNNSVGLETRFNLGVKDVTGSGVGNNNILNRSLAFLLFFGF